MMIFNYKEEEKELRRGERTKGEIKEKMSRQTTIDAHRYITATCRDSFKDGDNI
jgi:hypothetical protein